VTSLALSCTIPFSPVSFYRFFFFNYWLSIAFFSFPVFGGLFLSNPISLDPPCTLRCGGLFPSPPFYFSSFFPSQSCFFRRTLKVPLYFYPACFQVFHKPTRVTSLDSSFPASTTFAGFPQRGYSSILLSSFPHRFPSFQTQCDTPVAPTPHHVYSAAFSAWFIASPPPIFFSPLVFWEICLRRQGFFTSRPPTYLIHLTLTAPIHLPP